MENNSISREEEEEEEELGRSRPPCCSADNEGDQLHRTQNRSFKDSFCPAAVDQWTSDELHTHQTEVYGLHLLSSLRL